MTARGKQVKLQTLLTEKEIFVYDRELLSAASNASAKSALPEVKPSPPFTVKDPPDTSIDQSSLEAWQTLFKNRRGWAIELSKVSERMLKDARRFDAETIVIQRATAIAVENVKQHIAGLHQKYDEAKSWANQVLREHETLLSGWEASSSKLSLIPAKSALRPFLRMARQARTGEQTDRECTLQDFVDKELLRKAASISTVGSRRLSQQLSDLTKTYNTIVQDGTSLVDNFNNAFAASNLDVSEIANGLTEEIEAIVKKISSDYESNLNLASSPQSVAAIKKTASLHTRNFLPSLMEAATETDQLSRNSKERRSTIMRSALSYLQKISAVESVLAGIQPVLASLDIGTEDGEALDTVAFPQQLPYVYGSLLIELVRRREWDDKMKADSSTLAEEMGVHKEEEEKRRKKWLKSVNNYLNPEILNNKAMGIEVNLKVQEPSWPKVSRDDIGNFFSHLTELDEPEATLNDLRDMVKSLDAPTKQQIRRGNAFRNGSIHDAAYGKSSLLLRGDDELLRSLQNDKAKLEDRLKGSESRIRKLEDLLHRQTPISKPSIGNVGSAANRPVYESQSTSPIPTHVSPSPSAQDNLSRRPSISRRFSANLGFDDKALAQRIAKLEGELATEKTKNVRLEEASIDHAQLQEGLRKEVQEALSTKKDLLENFEAQQHEFEGERRLFTDKNSKLKIRLEELEEELDRVLGSHDNARVSLDEKRNIEAELEKVKREAAETVQKAQGQIDFLKSDYTMQREKANKLEKQVAQLEEDKTSLAAKNAALINQLRKDEQIGDDNLRALQAVHLQLSTDEVAPDDFSSLIEAIEILAERSQNHLQELKQTVETMRADNAVNESRLEKRAGELAALFDRLTTEQTTVSSLRKALGQQEGRCKTLEAELADERKELEKLRSKFAAGETGSLALRERVAEEEKKVGELSMRLESSKVHTKQLKSELATKTDHLEFVENAQAALISRLENRARRAEELSNLLFSYTERLSRLLEHIGFTILKQDDGMTVQKTPRTSSVSGILGDQSQLMNRSVSAPLPSNFDEPTPSYLRWAMADDQATEAQSYQTFLREIQTFDMDTFTEAVIKRVKETEHTARKWQREAKAYREKAHRAQLDAHEKVAIRSFKEGDLALFLPTRNQATRPWAAFNVGAPHYFLREQDSHRLRTREWLLARIMKVEERVVDLSKSITGLRGPPRRNSVTSNTASDGGASFEDDNPFELSDGLRWYLIDAVEAKPGAPSTPGLGKSTVASANVDARGSTSIPRKKTSEESRATKTLTKSLDSRRSSSGSKRSLIGATSSLPTQTSASAAIPEGIAQVQEGQSDSRPSSPAKQQHLDAEEGSSGAKLRAASPLKPTVVTSSSSSPVRSTSPRKSPEKPKRAWEGLWSLDLSLEGGGKGMK